MTKTYEELKLGGVELTEAPAKQPWAGLMGRFKDIDGKRLVLHDLARKRGRGRI